MPIITRKALGLDKEIADPKPATQIDYAGNPVPPGGHYNGRPEHMGNTPVVTQRERSVGRPPGSGNRKPRKSRLSALELRERIRAGHARARAAGKIFGFKWQRDQQAATQSSEESGTGSAPAT